jgi:hypothetical protein
VSHFWFVMLAAGRGPRGKGVGGGTAHNKPHPFSHASVARAVSRDASKLAQERMNRDWVRVSLQRKSESKRERRGCATQGGLVRM